MYDSELDDVNTKKLAVGAVVVEEMRAAVYAKTGFRCSAGIAHNKVSQAFTQNQTLVTFSLKGKKYYWSQDIAISQPWCLLYSNRNTHFDGEKLV